VIGGTAGLANRHIIFEGLAYTRKGFFELPKGKEWLLVEDKKVRPRVLCGRIDVFDPKVLRAVLATASVKAPGPVYDGTPTTAYRGTITLGELYRLSPAAFDTEPTGTYVRAKVSWRLWLGRDQLVRGAWSSWTQRFLTLPEEISTVVDLRLAGWGTKTRITPPPAEKVATRDQLVRDG
jgi:hypothetical protein